MRLSVSLSVFALIFASNAIFAENVFYCPATATCTGKTVSSCSVDGNTMGWVIESVGSLGGQVHPGIYGFSGATAADKGYSGNQHAGCIYGDINKDGISLHTTIPGKQVYFVYDGQAGNAWSHMANSSYQFCMAYQNSGQSNIVPSNCPMTLDATSKTKKM